MTTMTMSPHVRAKKTGVPRRLVDAPPVRPQAEPSRDVLQAAEEVIDAIVSPASRAFVERAPRAGGE
jgi:hypothetical protein